MLDVWNQLEPVSSSKMARKGWVNMEANLDLLKQYNDLLQLVELFHPEVQIWPRGSSNRHFLAPHGISIEPTTFFLRRNKRIKELKRALKWLNALQLLTPTSPFIVKSNLILPRGTKDKHPFNFFSPAYKIEKK